MTLFCMSQKFFFLSHFGLTSPVVVGSTGSAGSTSSMGVANIIQGNGTLHPTLVELNSTLITLSFTTVTLSFMIVTLSFMIVTLSSAGLLPKVENGAGVGSVTFSYEIVF